MQKKINTNFIEKKQYLCHREFVEHTFAISALSNLCAISKGALVMFCETFVFQKNSETQGCGTKKMPLNYLEVLKVC